MESYGKDTYSEERRQIPSLLPKDLAEDIRFPFKDSDAIAVKVSKFCFRQQQSLN